MTMIVFGRVEKERFSLTEFYLDRIKRIVPALTVMGAAVVVAGWFLLPPSEYLKLGSHLAGSLGFYSNILFLREAGYFNANAYDKWFLHTWSLAVEWQSYLLYPIFVILLRRWASKNAWRYFILALAASSFVLCIVVTKFWEDAAFYLLPTRAWEMLAGAGVYLFGGIGFRKYTKSIHLLGISLVGFSVFGYNTNLSWPGIAALLPVAGAMLVIFSALQSSFIASNASLQFLGKISYSTYLWHWPLVVDCIILIFTSNQFGLSPR